MVQNMSPDLPESGNSDSARKLLLLVFILLFIPVKSCRIFKVELLRLKNHPLSQKPPIIADSLKSLYVKSVTKDETDSKKYVNKIN